MSRQDKVQAYYGDSNRYSRQQFNVKLRAEALRFLVRDCDLRSIADIGCGHAMVSIPFLEQVDQLVLLDTSGAMLESAAANIPDEYKDKTVVVQGDVSFLDPRMQFDLVIAFGVLAHVAEPFDFLERCIQLVRPGGYLALQNTDAAKLSVRCLHAWFAIRSLFVPYEYRLNRIRQDHLLHFVQAHGLSLEGAYSYSQVFPLSFLFSGREERYRKIVGHYGVPGNQIRKGTDYLMLWQMKG